MTLRLESQLMLTEYLDGHRAILRANFSNPLNIIILKGFPVLFLLTAILSLWSSIATLNLQNNPNNITNSWLTWAIDLQLSQDDAIANIYLSILCFALAIVFPILINPNFLSKLRNKNLAKTWHNNPLMAEKRTISVTDSYLNLESETLQINCQLSALTRVIESESVFILYFFTKDIKMISKQSFIERESLSSFRELIQSNIKNYIMFCDR